MNQWPILLFFVTGFLQASSLVAYRVQLGEQANAPITVDVCFEGINTFRWQSSVEHAPRFIDKLTHASKQPSALIITPEINDDVRNNQIDRQTNSTSCFFYRVNVSKYLEQKSLRSNRRFSWLSENNDPSLITIPSGLFIFRPEHYPSDTRFQLTLINPSGLSTALPWPSVPLNQADRLPRSLNPSTAHPSRSNQLKQNVSVGETNTSFYVLNDYPSFMPIDVLIGNFEQQAFVLQHSHLLNQTTKVTVSFKNALRTPHQDTVIQWLKTVSSSLVQSHAALPSSINVHITDVKRSTAEPTPFGMVERGEGSVIKFLVNAEAPQSSFIDDWTGYHEFAHLLIPFVSRSDAWVSEGLASYYQYLLMGRAGVLSEQETFSRLYGGFQRGKNNYPKTAGQTLRSATEDMRQKRAYRRVYWTGAAAWLEADIHLLKNGRSLNALLAEFRQCLNAPCKLLTAADDEKVRQIWAHNTVWTASELASALDFLLIKQGNTPFFRPLFRKTANSDQYPAISSLFATLGISIQQDKQGVLQNAQQDRLQLKPNALRQQLLFGYRAVVE